MAANRIYWNKIKVDSQVLKELTARSDAKGFVQVGKQIVLTVLLGVLSYWAFKHLSLWVSIPIYLLYATVYSFMGYTSAVHELCHNTVFKTTKYNEFFMALFALFSWSDYVFFKASHMKHHHFTTHTDLDQEVELPIALSWKNAFQQLIFNTDKVGNCLSGLEGIVRRSMGILKGDWEEGIYANNEKLLNKTKHWDRVLISFHLLVVIGIVISGEWLFLLLITFTVFFGNGLNFALGMTQHFGLQSNVNDFRKNCRSTKLNPLFAFLYWQMNYHIEHHMYAAVPFYNLKKLHEVIEKDLPEPQTLTQAWKEMLWINQEQKKNPGYYKDVEVTTIN